MTYRWPASMPMGIVVIFMRSSACPSNSPWAWVLVLRPNRVEEKVYILACWCIQKTYPEFIDAYGCYCPSVRSSGHLGLVLDGLGHGCCHHWEIREIYVAITVCTFSFAIDILRPDQPDNVDRCTRHDQWEFPYLNKLNTVSSKCTTQNNGHIHIRTKYDSVK